VSRRRALGELHADDAGHSREGFGDARPIGIGGGDDVDDAVGDPDGRRGRAERLPEHGRAVSAQKLVVGTRGGGGDREENAQQ
jgi:hypothetical protein